MNGIPPIVIAGALQTGQAQRTHAATQENGAARSAQNAREQAALDQIAETEVADTVADSRISSESGSGYGSQGRAFGEEEAEAEVEAAKPEDADPEVGGGLDITA